MRMTCTMPSQAPAYIHATASYRFQSLAWTSVISNVPAKKTCRKVLLPLVANTVAALRKLHSFGHDVLDPTFGSHLLRPKSQKNKELGCCQHKKSGPQNCFYPFLSGHHQVIDAAHARPQRCDGFHLLGALGVARAAGRTTRSMRTP